MPARPRQLALLSLALLCAATGRTNAQLIQIKTLPVAEGDQWRLFPSANVGLGGISIALTDSLNDPFDNPAKGARLSERGNGLFFGAPTFYSVSKNAGGGRTFPLGTVMRSGSNFGGVVVALQEIDAINQQQTNFVAPGVDLLASDGTVVPRQGPPSRQNRFAFATAGHLFESAGVSVGASALWSGLNDIDGVDLLYSGSQRIDQHGGALDTRLAMLKQWTGGRSLEAMLLHTRFDMTQDVTWADQVWDPNTRLFSSRARMDHNLDRTNTWGLHLGMMQPIGDSGWRAGVIATTNLSSHPKLPDYQIAQIRSIPWDPGHTAAYDLGVGIAKSRGLTTFGVDAIFEPIHTHTWGETPDSIVTTHGILPAGSKTTENHFHFSNAIVRAGFGRDIPFDTLHGSTVRSIRLEGGLAMRSIDYDLDQTDHVAQGVSLQHQSWMEWTRTWGLVMRFSDLEVRYVGRATTGTGRPGVFSTGGAFFGGDAVSVPAAAGSNFIAAPSANMTLTGVAVTTHQISIAIPIR